MFAGRHRSNIRPQGFDLLTGGQFDEPCAPLAGMQVALNPQRGEHLRGRLALLRFSRREIQGQPVALAAHGQPTGSGRKVNQRIRIIQVMKYHVRAGKRGVAAEIDLIAGGKPAQRKTIALRYHKRGFRLVVLLRHFEQQLIRQPFFKQAYRSRVAGERLVAERRHQIKRNFRHRPSLTKRNRAD